MKRKYYFILYFLLVTKLSFAQTGWSSNDSVKTKFKFLYIINFHDKAPVATENAFINPAEKDTTYGLPYSQNNAIYQLLKIDRIIYVKIKSGIKLLTLSDIFNLYNIQLKFRKFRVKVNDMVINNPETILFSENIISKVKIENGYKNNYINIIGKGYYKAKKELEKQIKDGDEFIK